MVRLNCPNCGAPIDIHRKDCEYCGTPYDLKDREVLYADNQAVYIHQEPIKWNNDQIINLSAQTARGMSKTAWSLDTDIKMLLNQIRANEFQIWQQQQIRECCNSLPKVSYGSLIEEPKDEATSYIWETIKIVLVTVAFFLPVLIPIILGALDIF